MGNYQNRTVILGQVNDAWINPATVISTLSVNA